MYNTKLNNTLSYMFFFKFIKHFLLTNVCIKHGPLFYLNKNNCPAISGSFCKCKHFKFKTIANLVLNEKLSLPIYANVC